MQAKFARILQLYPVKEEHIIEKPENTVIFGKKFFYDWKFSLNVVIV